MPYKAIICDPEKFDSLFKKAGDYVQKKYGSKSIVWCKKFYHPKDGRLAFTVKDRILPILKGEKIVELTNDWFITEEI